LHLVGYLYCWQVGFNSVFKGLRVKFVFILNIVNFFAKYKEKNGQNVIGRVKTVESLIMSWQDHI